MKKISLALGAMMLVMISCSDQDEKQSNIPVVNEDPATFKKVGSIDFGEAGAAEISAYDEKTNRLFTINNSKDVNQIEVIDLTDLKNPKKIATIDLNVYNGASNSVAVYDGKLAVALESKTNKQNDGKVVVLNTTDYTLIKEITVGALPDMLTFSPDGQYILTANEGEPSMSLSSDPIGSVSIIEVANNYTAKTLDFSAFASQMTTLKNGGFRISTIGTFASDVEPEYLTISSDSKTAWVTLQENNGVAKIDLVSKSVTNIFPLGFKDFNSLENAIDISDKDSKIEFKPWKVKGLFMPDAIANYTVNGTTYFITANEGDAREYTGYADVKRVKDLNLDPTSFPNATELKAEALMGRLNAVSTMGDKDSDGDLDEIVSFGARSFTIWNGNSGSLVYDSKNDLDQRALAAGTYDDARSDDKSSEPEAVFVSKMGDKDILFVGLERSNLVVIYDISNPLAPKFLQSIKTAIGPEGLLFIPASKNASKKSLLVVSNEVDGIVELFQPDLQ